MRAAMRLHRDLATPDRIGNSLRVDVFDAISRSGAMLMFQPLDKLLGAYMQEDGESGIIITTQRPVGVQRFTAGHELGHLVMGHRPHADDENILRRVPLGVGRYNRVPLQEREADAFASHFLLPRFLIANHHRANGLSRRDYENPQCAYQASHSNEKI
jgi:Zn-dependent peptidase ImmA (M78 family)